MFLLSLLDPSALSELSLPARRRPPPPATPGQRASATARSLRALQASLARDRGIVMEPKERETAQMYLESVALGEKALTLAEVDDRLTEAVHTLFSYVVMARRAYAAYLRGVAEPSAAY